MFFSANVEAESAPLLHIAGVEAGDAGAAALPGLPPLQSLLQKL